MLCSIVSGGVGLTGFGLVHDFTGGYAFALALAAVLMLLAATLLYGVPQVRPLREVETRSEVNPAS